MTVRSLLERADSCWENSRFGRSVEGLAEARALLAEAQAAGDEEAVASVNRCIGWFCLQLGYNDIGIEAADAARAYYADKGNDAAHGLTLAVSAWLLSEHGLGDLSFESAQLATAVAVRTGDVALQAFVLNCKAVALLRCEERKLAHATIKEAVELAHQSGDRPTIAMSFLNTGYIYLIDAETYFKAKRDRIGRTFTKEGIRWSAMAIEVAQAAGDLWNLRIAMNNTAEAYCWLGLADDAEEMINRIAALPGNTGPREQIHALYTQSELYGFRGDHERALSCLYQALTQLEKAMSSEARANVLRRIAEMKQKSGDFEGAYEYHRAFHDAYVFHISQTTNRRVMALDRQLRNDKLREKTRELETQVVLDPLTGVFNRRAFDKAFELITHRKAVVGILDIDHFKEVNDRFSHIVGDQALVRMAKFLRDFSPEMDIYRIGGEEFALVFRNVSMETAEPLAQALVERVRELDFRDIHPELALTVSIGIVEAGVLYGSALLAEADRRLYVAKKSGRNCVVSDNRSSLVTIPAE